MEDGVARPRRTWRIIRWVGAIGLLAALLVYISLSVVVAHILTRPNNRANTINKAEISPSAVDWSTRTADGLLLKGWYCPTASSDRLIILVHGMGGSRDEMAGIARDLHAEGFAVLLFDLRGHGTSDPSRLYMGDRERGDIRAALDWARTEGYTPDRIGWLGYSMGGATLLLEGAKNPNLSAVVIDSAYGDLPELLDRQLTQHSGLPALFNPGILLAARLAFGVKTDHLVPIDAARGWNRPILLIHGESDSIVPVEQARRLARSIGANCQAEFRPNLEHVGAYNDSPAWYIATVKDFFDRNLAPPSRSSTSSESHP